MALLLPQPGHPLTNDKHSTSTNNPRSTTNYDSDANIAAADNATIIADAPTNFAVVFDDVDNEPVPANKPANVEVIADEATVEVAVDDLIANNSIVVEDVTNKEPTSNYNL